MLPVILIMRLIFCTNNYWLIQKFQRFVKLLQMVTANMKFSKTQLSEMSQLGWVLGEFLGSLIKNGLPSIKNVLTSLVKTIS